MRSPVLGLSLALLLVTSGVAHAQSPSPAPSLPPVGPDATPYLSAVPGLAPVPAPTGPAWTQTLSSQPDGSLYEAIAWGDGVAAIGVDGKDRNVSWASPDGLSWTRAERPFRGVPDRWAPMHLVAFGDRLLAIGSDGMRLAVWSSTDGLRWTRQADSPAFASGGVDFQTTLQVTGAAAAADRILVTGYYDFDSLHASRTWWSDDGTTWHRVRIDDPTLLYLDRPIAVTDGFLAVACCTRSDTIADTQQLVRSTDGITWSVVGALPWKAYGPLAARASNGMLFLSGFPGEDSDTPAATVWSSPDGAAWTQLATGPEGISGESSLAVDDSLVLLAGDGYEDEVSSWAWTLGSTDGGPWELSAGWPGMTPACIDALVLLPARAVAVGGCREGAAWSMERPG